jgi:hypothetical protein
MDAKPSQHAATSVSLLEDIIFDVLSKLPAKPLRLGLHLVGAFDRPQITSHRPPLDERPGLHLISVFNGPQNHVTQTSLEEPRHGTVRRWSSE